MGLGLGRRAHLGLGIQVDPIVDDGRSAVCDGAHRLFVMNISLSQGLGTAVFCRATKSRPFTQNTCLRDAGNFVSLEVHSRLFGAESAAHDNRRTISKPGRAQSLLPHS